MNQHTATVTWSRGDAPFTDVRYSRGHTWHFDGGIDVPASSSPHNVRLPFSVEAAVDPEEAFVAALSSCHLLSFLYVAAKRGFVVDAYRDEAAGVLAKDDRGKMSMTVVTLKPVVTFAGSVPSEDEHAAMHHKAHEDCFIASSVRTDVRCEPTIAS
jgi:organic hydroperoxide reductase OsmC/OhrA